MIVDQKQFDRFIKIMPDLKDDEVYFISLSARNKYLTDEERVKYGLGRTEMFGRTVVKSKNDFGYAMDKLKAMLLYKHTRNGSLIPTKSLVVYINVNPSSMIKAYEMFVNEMNKELFQALQSIRNNKETNFDGFLNMERKMMNCVQKSGSRRHFIDIDIDDDGPYILAEFRRKLKGTVNHVIRTQGGFHILIEKETLCKEIRLHDIVKEMNIIAKENEGEVVFNKNLMVPVPGTLQAGKLVKLWD